MGKCACCVLRAKASRGFGADGYPAPGRRGARGAQVVALRNAALKDRHWQKVFAAIGTELVRDSSFTLQVWVPGLGARLSCRIQESRPTKVHWAYAGPMTGVWGARKRACMAALCTVAPALCKLHCRYVTMRA